MLSSCLEASGKKAELLADICRRLDADVYLSPPGALSYIEESDAFERAGIQVVMNEYHHPTYQQLHGSFTSHLSVIDLLFNVGSDSLDVIRGAAP